MRVGFRVRFRVGVGERVGFRGRFRAGVGVGVRVRARGEGVSPGEG